jgi:hypothetical protein
VPRKDHIKLDPGTGKLRSASELARIRALDRAGLDQDWYNARVAEITDELGQVICQECSQPERKKVGRQLKDLVFNADSKKLICSSCADKAYKATMKAKVEKRYKGPATAEEFHIKNRNTLDESEKRAYEDREGDVILLAQALEAHMADETWDAEGLNETILEVCDEVEKHGMIGDIFYDSKWWMDADGLKKMLSVGGAQSTFTKCGYYIALPSRIAVPFLHFAEEHLGISGGCAVFPHRIARIRAAVKGETYHCPDELAVCSTRGCGATEVKDPTKTYLAAHYCVKCQAARDKHARAAQAVISEQKIASQVLSDASKDAWVERATIFKCSGTASMAADWYCTTCEAFVDIDGMILAQDCGGRGRKPKGMGSRATYLDRKRDLFILS